MLVIYNMCITLGFLKLNLFAICIGVFRKDYVVLGNNSLWRVKGSVGSFSVGSFSVARSILDGGTVGAIPDRVGHVQRLCPRL